MCSRGAFTIFSASANGAAEAPGSSLGLIGAYGHQTPPSAFSDSALASHAVGAFLPAAGLSAPWSALFSLPGLRAAVGTMTESTECGLAAASWVREPQGLGLGL